MIVFIKKRLISFSNLAITTLPFIAILPTLPNLSITKNAAISIRPHKVYHLSIINDSESMFKKNPDSLTKEEILKFNHFRNWKSQVGDPLETNDVYLPIGGLRTCMICGHLT